MFGFLPVTFSPARRCLYSLHGTSMVRALLRRSTPTPLPNYYSKDTKNIPPYLSKYLIPRNPVANTSYQHGKPWAYQYQHIKPSATEHQVHLQDMILAQKRRPKYFSQYIKTSARHSSSKKGEVEEEDKSEPKVFDTIVNKKLGAEGHGGGGDDGGGHRKRARMSWQKIKYSLLALGVAITGGFGYGVIYFGKPKVDDYGDPILDKYSQYPPPLEYLYRAADEINYYNKLIKEPSRDKLLPDVLKPPYYQPPYTLVLEFTDVLVHPEWTYNTGWRFKKRPGLDQFLETLYTHYEMVVYTAEMGMTVFPIIEALDTNNLISYKLVRDATNFVDGHHVKDLDKLNRDLSKVIVLDWNPNSTKLHVRNLFKIDRWNGNDDDTLLLDLTSFLLAISEWNVEDVRTVLEHYSEYEDPISSFKERQKILASSQMI